MCLSKTTFILLFRFLGFASEIYTFWQWIQRCIVTTDAWKWSKKQDKMGQGKGITKGQTVTGFYIYIKLILQILGYMSVRSTLNPKKAKNTTYTLLVTILLIFSPTLWTLCTFSIWWMDILNLDLFQSTSIFIYPCSSLLSTFFYYAHFFKTFPEFDPIFFGL